MKKLFIILMLSFSLLIMHGCVRDEEDPKDNSLKPDGDIDIDIGDEIYSEDLVSGGDKEPAVGVSDEKSTVYKNDRYGFALEIPGWWEGTYSVEEEAWFDETSTSISFNFEDGDIYSNVFTIIIYDQTIKMEEWDDPFLIYIGEKDGRTYAYLQAMEPPVDVLEEKNDKYLRLISKMVEEVPEIIETFIIEN